ncbi:MAG: hypothetical protein WBP93_05375 [Pyrinomonadaceae bacterium]
MRARQLFAHKPLIVQQARETFTGRFKAVKESGKRRLTATPHAQERKDEIANGFLLMSMCVRQNKTDILAKASGKRALVHRRNNALTRGELVTTRLLFQMCPDFRCYAIVSMGQSQQTTPQPPSTQSESSTSRSIDITGKFDAQTYTNQFFGFSMTLPNGWQGQDAEAVRRAKEAVQENAQGAFGDANSATRRGVRKSISQSAFLASAVKPTGGATNPYLMIMAENISTAYNVRTPQQYVTQMQRLNEVAKGSPVEFDNDVTSEPIGGAEFAVTNAVRRNPGINGMPLLLRHRIYVMVRKDFALVFTLTYNSEEQLESGLEVIRSLKFQ